MKNIIHVDKIHMYQPTKFESIKVWISKHLNFFVNDRRILNVKWRIFQPHNEVSIFTLSISVQVLNI